MQMHKVRRKIRKITFKSIMVFRSLLLATHRSPSSKISLTPWDGMKGSICSILSLRPLAVALFPRVRLLHVVT